MERCLYIVPTPIGNLADITVRAREILASVDLIAAEDTRHSRKLLTHLDIDTPMCAYHEHVDNAITDRLVAQIIDGKSIALISDAGTPLVSDPGFRLVRAAQDAGCTVIPLPGPCAAIAALSASGLPTDRFAFEGFLPAKAGPRDERLRRLKLSDQTLVFYEAPHRILDTLNAMIPIFGVEREVVMARELTKSFETIRRAALGELAQWVSEDANQQRGEHVLMVGPPPKATGSFDASVDALLIRLGAELPPRKAAALVAEIHGLKAREVYERLLQLKD